ncbi:MAG: DUF1405 domain-containing protein [archaeon]|nr:DUF1405 domain-containing protein [Candidatus Micrarchaeota archaeon]
MNLINKTNLLALIIICNLIGFLYGLFFFYGEQLLQTEPLYWIFVIDCPLYALLMALTLILIKLNKSFNLLYFISAAGALKYGFWTVFVLLNYSSYYFSPATSFIYFVLLFGHIGLFLEVFLLNGRIKLRNYFLPLALLWFLLNDAADYFFQSLGITNSVIRPPIPSTAIEFMALFTITASIFFTLLAFLIYSKFKKPIINLF